MNPLLRLIHPQFSSFPTLFVQGDDSFDRFKSLLGSSAINPEMLLQILVTVTVLILLITFLAYKYQRWKRYQEFLREMKALDLDPNAEGTLAGMVKRYSMDEPVKIFFSVRLFDDMASTEMWRVLGSAGSQKAKQEFIDTLYTIRDRTYHPDWKELVNPNLGDKKLPRTLTE